jgi:hypothetical protein
MCANLARGTCRAACDPADFLIFLMRRFLTIGITATGKVDVLHSADKEKREHIDEFNQLAKTVKGKKAKKGKYAEIQVVDISRGVIKRKRNGELEGGKRTVARIVEKRKKKAVTKKTKKAAKKAPKRNARKKAPQKPPTPPPADNGSANEGGAPALPGAQPTT